MFLDTINHFLKIKCFTVKDTYCVKKQQVTFQESIILGVKYVMLSQCHKTADVNCLCVVLKLMTLFEGFLTYDNSQFLVVHYTDARMPVYSVC